MRKIKEPLAKHTTFNIGGEAEILIPESTEELIETIENFKLIDKNFRLLGNGSNVLVSDRGIRELVIKTTNFDKSILIEGNRVTTGASVLLLNLVKRIIKHNLGGIEYLCSVPGTVGGAIYMNAGRGRAYNKAISDFLISVEVFDGEKVFNILKENLKFDYRYSSFHEYSNWVILSAKFDFLKQKKEIGEEKIRERLNIVKERERTKPNIGSIFRNAPRFPMKGVRLCDAKFVSNNRICNMGNARFWQVFFLIKIAQLIHIVIPFFKKLDLEIQIWK